MKELPNRRTTRAQWHDYNSGAYHITLCTRDRAYSFGEIKDGEMHLSNIGDFLKHSIESIQQHAPYAEIPVFQIMPDHVHLLVIIHPTEAGSKDDACIVPRYDTSIVPDINPKMKKVSDCRGKLSVIIGGIKSATTKYAHENGINFAWVTRFNDQIKKTTCGNSDITEWLLWFLSCLKSAMEKSLQKVSRTMKKTKFWDKHFDTPINERQRKIINMLWDGFDGKLNTSKWAKICKCSQDTALRDIHNLIEKGILRQTDEGGRSTNYVPCEEY